LNKFLNDAEGKLPSGFWDQPLWIVWMMPRAFVRDPPKTSLYYCRWLHAGRYTILLASNFLILLRWSRVAVGLSDLCLELSASLFCDSLRTESKKPNEERASVEGVLSLYRLPRSSGTHHLIISRFLSTVERAEILWITGVNLKGWKFPEDCEKKSFPSNISTRMHVFWRSMKQIVNFASSCVTW